MPDRPVSHILWIDGAAPGPLGPPTGPSVLVHGADSRLVTTRTELEDALSSGTFDLVILGPMLPDLGELELMERLEAASPSLTILRSSSLRGELERRREIQKDAMRALAAGVAHDLNNMLGVIASYASVFRDELADSDPRRSDTLEILGACERARATTDQLLAFSRRRPVLPERLDLSAHLARRRELLERQLGAAVEWRMEIEPGLVALVDPTQFDEALLQLVLNANDAMPKGGRLGLEAKAMRLDEAPLGARGSIRPGPGVRVSLEDDGVGMSSEVQAQIFEPFFTHGRGGKGRGLGLCIVEGFVLGARGAVHVESAPHQGTRVSLYLPALDLGPVTLAE